MNVAEQINHPFWKRAVRIDGYEGWHCPMDEELSDGRRIQIRVEFDNPDDEIVQQNYTAIRQRWLGIWSRIQLRTHEMKMAYGYAETNIRTESD